MLVFRGVAWLPGNSERLLPILAARLWAKQVMADLYAEVVTTTARFLYHGFHVELVERTTAIYPTTSNDETSSSQTFRIQSSGRRLRQQHQGLEDS